MRLILQTLLFTVVFWNLENCFDCIDSGTSASDKEFSARGSRHWTRKRFDEKTALIGKTLLWCEELPSIVGVAEIENSRVLKNIIYSDVLRKCEYAFIHYESRDPRGIDTGLLYLKKDWEAIASYPLPVIMNGDTLRTRDILYACMQSRTDGSVWHFFVNHHPSKYGGGSSSERRLAAMETLRTSVDSLLDAGAKNIVAMGDFNDIPSGEAFARIEGSLVNLGANLINGEGNINFLGTSESIGTIRFKGKWELIDNFLVSPDLVARQEQLWETTSSKLSEPNHHKKRQKGSPMTILRPPFIMERDSRYPGEKPRRTYIGPRYNGGVSDHLPIKLELK